MTKAHPLRTAIITGITAGIAWSQWEARAFIEANRFRRGALGFLQTGFDLLPFHIVPTLAAALFAAAIFWFGEKLKKRQGAKSNIWATGLPAALPALAFFCLFFFFGFEIWAAFYIGSVFVVTYCVIILMAYEKTNKLKKIEFGILFPVILFGLFWGASWISLPEPPRLPPDGKPPVKISDTGLNVFLLALDGADWEFLQPGIDNGDLPNLELLVATGASGPLKTHKPTSSPILWTTIATGKKPDKHGIEGWVVHRLKPFGARFLHIPPKSFIARLNGKSNRLLDMTPLTSNYRRCRAIWNVLQDRDDKSIVIGWWVTWPAEKIKGVMVTPYAWPFVDTVMLHENLLAAHPPGSTYPESMMEKLKPLVTKTEEVKKKNFMGLPPAVMEKLYPQAESYDLWYYAKDISFIKMADQLLTDHPDYTFASVYIEGIDLTQHIFLRYARPDWFKGKQHPSEKEKAELGLVISNYYKWVDGRIGELLRHADGNTVVGIVSDHGVEAGWRNMHYSGDHKKGPPGVIILSGGPIKRGTIIENAGIEDVTPTLLYLLGYPVGEDMDGKVITGAIDDDFLKQFPVRKIPTLDGGFEWGGEADGSVYDRGLIEKLKNIGYL